MLRLILGAALCFFSAGFCNAAYSLKRIEPLNWWVGMQRPELQLMLHGERIAELRPLNSDVSALFIATA